ncbi:hypothetical protein E1B28_007557 [Marasmius oreades]|uniref:DUF7330 domain-containing protein n=1 Tax=Marasmius oreades TaxID=181124 RepID=A0A9P7S3A1_9AGAR|nr:uncharacterized protein E1B28_007557 [Marasmius oreades]KAG7093921.1 hypothetical protein E1B28_007557 [Marasmius oreades]
MIITSTDDSSPGAKQREVNLDSEAVSSREFNTSLPAKPVFYTQTDAPPPPYVSSEGAQLVGQNEDHIPANLKPTNFISVHHKDSPEKGSYAIDPSIRIPESFLPPLEIQETDNDPIRKNFQVLSKNGSVDTQVYIVPDSKPFDERKRVTMDIISKNGSVTAKIVRYQECFSMDENVDTIQRRAGSSYPPFALRCYSHNGCMHVAIPRSFHGSLSLSTRAHGVKLSEQVRAEVTVFNDTSGIKQYYIGPLNGHDHDEARANEDEVVVEGKNGSIRVTYSDEVIESVFKGFMEMLGRIF